MRVQQKEATRQRIVDSAIKAVRKRGLDAPSVSEVMGAAGLTVGGFYAHFGSKDALMLAALEQAFSERHANWETHMPDVPAAERRALAGRTYLSRQHRDAQVECCPLPAILSELPHQSADMRDALARHLEVCVKQMVDTRKPAERSAALTDLALMIGGLTLARALGSTPLSDEVLAAARTAIR